MPGLPIREILDTDHSKERMFRERLAKGDLAEYRGQWVVMDSIGYVDSNPSLIELVRKYPDNIGFYIGKVPSDGNGIIQPFGK